MSDQNPNPNGVKLNCFNRRIWLAVAVAVAVVVLFAGWYIARNNSGNDTSSAITNTPPIVRYSSPGSQ